MICTTLRFLQQRALDEAARPLQWDRGQPAASPRPRRTPVASQGDILVYRHAGDLRAVVAGTTYEGWEYAVRHLVGVIPRDQRADLMRVPVPAKDYDEKVRGARSS